jgi:Tol biopolymer transport system component
MRCRLAHVMAAVVMATTLMAAGQSDPARVLFEAARKAEIVDGDLKVAIEQYKKVVASANRALAAQALVRMAESYEKLGDAEAKMTYERVVREFGDQREAVAVARARLGGSGSGTARLGDRAVWMGPKVDLFGRVSPNGRFISFTDWEGFGNLTLHDLTSNTDRTLSGSKGWGDEDPNRGDAGYSAVSPDGEYVAYGWLNQRLREIRIVPVAEANVRQPRTLLTFNPDEVRFLGVRDWSPDGKLLAVGTSRSDGTSQIIVAGVADGSMRVLKSHGWRGAEAMFFSRDSRYLAFDLPASDEVDQRDIFILAVDGSREVRAVADSADDRVAGWSPDGRFLLLTSTRTGSPSLWALPLSGGTPQGRPELVKTDIGSSVSLGLTNSGALYIYKNISSRDVKVARIDLSTGSLIGQPVHFSQGLLPVPMSPHWSPDGKSLVYQVRGSEEGLAIRSVDTGEVRRMPRRIPYATDPRWSPDGRSLIAGGRDDKGRDGIFQIDVRSGEATPIVYTRGLGSRPRWSADGTKIYYLAADKVENTLLRERDLRTGVERDVFAAASLREIEVSPDGRYVAAQTGRNDPASRTLSLLLVPVAGGEPRELVRVPAAAAVTNAWGTLAWTPDSRALLTARRAGSAVELWLIETDAGRARKLDIDVSGWALAEGAGIGGGFALSPDGQSITFSMGKSSAEVWALENFLPGLKP